MFELIAALPVAIAVWLTPGYLLLRSAGIRGLAAWGSAASVTALFTATAITVYPKVSLPWNAGTALAGLIVVLGMTVAARYLTARTRARRHASKSTQPRLTARECVAPLNSGECRIAIGAVFVAGLIPLLVVLLALPDSSAPLQVRDGIVHLNAIAHIRDSGSASFFGGLDPVIAYPGAGVFYPSTWHAVTALIPGVDAAQAATVSALAVMVAVWPLAMMLFARAIVPRLPGVAIIVAALSSSLSFFPYTQHVLNAQSPNALGTALLPSGLALILLALKSPRRVSLWVMALVNIAGACAAHPNTVFSAFALSLPILVAYGARYTKALIRRDTDRPAMRRKILVAFALVLGVFVAGAAAVRFSPLWPVLQAVMNYEQTIQTRSYLFTSGRLLSDVSLGRVPGTPVVVVLVIVAVIFLLRRGVLRWLVVMWAGTIALAAIAGGPDNALRGLTGVWYKHVFRLEALYPIPAIILAALGAVIVGRYLVSRGRQNAVGRQLAPDRARGFGGDVASWDHRSSAQLVPALGDGRVHRMVTAVTLAAVLATCVFQIPGMVDRSRGVYDPQALAARGALIVDEDDREALAQLASILPSDAKVVADPMSGGVLASGMGGVDSVFQRPNYTGLSPDGAYIVQHFDELATNRQVCAALTRLGAQYAYLDEDFLPAGARHAQASAGFADVDVTSGFAQLTRFGSVGIYRITGCVAGAEY